MMSDTLTRRFRSQLTVAMDSVLRKTVMDIVGIFENSVCDYQKELLLKEEQLARLSRKLARTELQLTRIESQKASDVKKLTSDRMTQNGCEKASDVSVQTCNASFVESKQVLDLGIPATTQTSLNSQEEITPCVQAQRFLVQQSSAPKTEPEEVGLDQQPSMSKTESSAGSSREKKLQKKKLKYVKQCHPGRSNLVIYLRDIKDGHSGRLEAKTSTTQQMEKTSVEAETRPDSNAAHFVLKKQVTAEEESGRTPKQACVGCKKLFPYPDIYERHLKHCRKLKRPANSRTPEQRRSERRQLRSSRSLSPNRKHHLALETQFACNRCRQKFGSCRSLSMHMRIHERKGCPAPSWTAPIEDDVL